MAQTCGTCKWYSPCAACGWADKSLNTHRCTSDLANLRTWNIHISFTTTERGCCRHPDICGADGIITRENYICGADGNDDWECDDRWEAKSEARTALPYGAQPGDNNHGLATCRWCGAATKKLLLFTSITDICPQCKR